MASKWYGMTLSAEGDTSRSRQSGKLTISPAARRALSAAWLYYANSELLSSRGGSCNNVQDAIAIWRAWGSFIMSKSNGNSKESEQTPPTITTLSVAGFKSFSQEQTIDIRALTLLAGANNSGKSSMMQPLLLLKQTLEAQYDPGPLLLDGPNAKFTSVSQFWPRQSAAVESARFVVTVGASDKKKIGFAFRWTKKKKKLAIAHTHYYLALSDLKLSERTPTSEVIAFLRDILEPLPEAAKLMYEKQLQVSENEIRRARFFLEFISHFKGQPRSPGSFSLTTVLSPRNQDFEGILNCIMEVIHLPGLRGNPERTYPVTAAGETFPGTFESYVASVIAHWSSESAEKARALDNDLKSLGLTWKIEARRIADTHVELHVGRMPRPKQGGAHDLVSIADVGFGVSQTLPVVVALQAARPGQLVYIEQPEIHLHPRAQVAMARLLVNAAKRGVRVVAETHSSLILLAVQTLVAEGVIAPGLVGLNWFVRNQKTGTTRIQRAEIDAAGRFGDWPEDFDEVALNSESRYLAAAEARLAGS
jgi:predicted ATPase